MTDQHGALCNSIKSIKATSASDVTAEGPDKASPSPAVTLWQMNELGARKNPRSPGERRYSTHFLCPHSCWVSLGFEVTGCLLFNRKQTNLEVQPHWPSVFPQTWTQITKHLHSREGDTEFPLVEKSIIIFHSLPSILIILLDKEIMGLLKSLLSGQIW